MTRRYNLTNIRTLLVEGFTAEDLLQLCFDIPAFRAVYPKLSPNAGKTEIVSKLLEYADQTLQIETLLAKAKEHAPTRYEIHQPYYDDNSVIIPTFKSDKNNQKKLLLISGTVVLIMVFFMGVCLTVFLMRIIYNERIATTETITAVTLTAPVAQLISEAISTPILDSTPTLNSSANTILPPTGTLSPTDTPKQLPTNTPTSSFTDTFVPPTPTLAPTIPVAPPTPTYPPLPPPTFTPIPPTLTPIPTNTPQPPPTSPPPNTPIPTPCPIPTATHKLLTYKNNNYFWVDARLECAKAHSGERPADCQNTLGGDADGSVLLGTFSGAENFINSIQSNETPVNIQDDYSRPAWPIKFFWKVPPDFFENANGHFTEAPNPAWLVLNEPHTNNPAQFSVSFLQGVKDAQFQEECSTKDYAIISVIGYLNDPNLHLYIEKLP